MVSGRGPVRAVDWREMVWREGSERTEDTLEEPVGIIEPAGRTEFPVRENVCRPTRLVREVGRVAGTPGKTNVL